jgi:NurA-like 5'-3' nuclease
MTSELSETLEDIHVQSLEIDLIEYLSERLQIDNKEAMKLYYNSKLCQQIHEGNFDIQYLDYKYLAEDLIENELTAKLY